IAVVHAVADGGVGAELQQQLYHLWTIHAHGKVQRQLMVFVVAHLASQHGRVGRHDPPHFVAKIQRDRGEDVMARAATDEETRDGAVRVVVGLVPARRPTNHLELVVVTVTDHVAAGVGQTPYDVQVSGRGGPVHRVRVVPFL